MKIAGDWTDVKLAEKSDVFITNKHKGHLVRTQGHRSKSMFKVLEFSLRWNSTQGPVICLYFFFGRVTISGLVELLLFQKMSQKYSELPSPISWLLERQENRKKERKKKKRNGKKIPPYKTMLLFTKKIASFFFF